MITIELAYICGMIHKILYNFDLVFWLYVLNFVMVLIDLLLMIRYTKLDVFRQRHAQLRAKKKREAHL